MSKEIETATLVEKAELVTPCFLCGELIPIFHEIRVPKICTDCRNLWKKIKEKDSEQREAD